MKISESHFFVPAMWNISRNLKKSLKQKKGEWKLRHTSYSATLILMTIVYVEGQLGASNIASRIGEVSAKHYQKAIELSTVRDTIAHTHAIKDIDIDVDEDGPYVCDINTQGDMEGKKYRQAIGRDWKTKELEISLLPDCLTIDDVHKVLNTLIGFHEVKPEIPKSILVHMKQTLSD